MASTALFGILALLGMLSTSGGLKHCDSVGYTTKWIFFIQCYGITKDTLFEVTAALTRIKIKFPTYVIAVDCSDSAGNDFPDDIFADYKIVSVTMRNSGFLELPYGLLSNLKDYVFGLDFSSNQIDNVDWDRLNRLPFAGNLTLLQLQNNRIWNLAEDAFSVMKKLSVLKLQANLIQDLPNNVFQGLTHLRELYVHENQIRNVGPTAFAYMPKLELLAMDLNMVEFLEEGTFSMENQTKLTELPLEGNPFHCNCSLQWLKDYLISIDYLTSSGATCIYPKIAPFAAVDFCNPEYQEDQQSKTQSKILVPSRLRSNSASNQPTRNF